VSVSSAPTMTAECERDEASDSTNSTVQGYQRVVGDFSPIFALLMHSPVYVPIPIFAPASTGNQANESANAAALYF